ncbi:hypothetical protein SALBM311S_00602 [Streptomyces alboniger]
MPAHLQLPYSAAVPAASCPSSSASTTQTCPADVTVSAAAGRSALERRARLTAKLAKLAATGQLAPLARQIAGLGGCAHPIRLTGHRTQLDTATGEILDHFELRLIPRRANCRSAAATAALPAAPPAPPSTATTPTNSSPPDSAATTVPTSVAAHPRVFATLTAPGFGPVHNQPAHPPLPLRPHPLRQRPVAGTARPRALRLHRRGPVERARPGPMGPLHHPPTSGDRQGRRPHPARAAAPRHALVRQGRRVPKTRPGPLPRRHPPRRTHRPHQRPTRLGHHPTPRPRRPRRRHTHPRRA